ncbi:carbohydrate kinase [Leptobacterium flavescens]|uniref:Carbohydrate kinase n=1 Tax=Leptobacterium flavescens TaxID=472055 RepID=A0A6P0UMY3_9FLAO|nr:carbohydrate kinase [Leptobacterium flavescens]NER14377.1 carbohydrate kinase [Leptobacterium flavescens]
MKNIYCIGEMLIDFVAERQGSDLSKATEFTKKAGGAPANVAAAIAKLGGQSYFVGCVGDDPFGNFLMNTMEDHRVSVSFVQRSSTFTTLAFVSLAEDGERDFVFSRGADKELVFDPKLAALFPGQILHFGAATALLGGELEKAYSQYLQEAFKVKAFICFDPNFRGDLWKQREDEFVNKCLPFIGKAHLCKFSLEEAQLISGKKNIENACRELHQTGAKAICITLGKEGTLLSTSYYQKQIESIAINPVDTTGAGDAFIGCLLKQLSEVEDPETVLKDKEALSEMVRKANIAGAITATQYGAIAALPGPEQLNAY